MRLRTPKPEPDRQTDPYRTNERSTNRLVGLVSLAFLASALGNELFVRLDYSYGVQQVNHQVLLPMGGVILILVLVCWHVRFDRPWVKYLLLGSITLGSVTIFFVFTTYTAYFLFLPLFIATRYFDRRLIWQVGLANIGLFLVACWLNFRLEAVSETVRYLHHLASFNSWENWVDVLAYLVMPITLLSGFLAAYSVSLTDNGRRLIESQAQSLVREAAVERELAMAAEIQTSALPAPAYTTPEGSFSLCAREQPAREVGGDFYDYFPVNDHLLALLVADVSDKGVPAALFMMSAKKAIRCAVDCCSSLDRAVAMANRHICQDNSSGMFLTLWLGIVDTRSGICRYCNAGHLPPVLRKGNGQLQWLENEPNLFLGTFPQAELTVNSFRMEQGDLLVLYTDGITDAENPEAERFGSRRLLEAAAAGEARPEAVADRILEQAGSFAGTAEQFDDMTLLVLACREVQTPLELEMTVPAEASGTRRLLDALDELLDRAACPEDVRRNLDVILDELADNVAEYAYEDREGKLELRALAGSSFVRLALSDTGTPFDPLAQPEPLPTDQVQMGGLGIHLIRSLADEVSYEYKNGRNVTTVSVFWGI